MHRRLLFNDIYNHIDKKQVSLIIGARQTGKTTLMQQLHDIFIKEKRQSFFLSLEDPAILKLLDDHPNNLFQVLPPLNQSKLAIIFIDEIQYLSNPSNFLKYHFDKYQTKIKLIVSGSSSFYIDNKFKDSLAGRKRIFKLLTLSFEEYLTFNNREELSVVPNKGSIAKIHFTDLQNCFHDYILYGGYPEVVLEKDIDEKQAILNELVNSYVKKDALEANVKYHEIYLKILKTVAGNSGILNPNTLGKDFNLNHTTVENYLSLMEKSFYITRVRPFYRNIKKELRKMSKFYFNDLGLRNCFVRNFDPLILRSDKGELLENYVFRRFLERYDEIDIRFWRTQKKQEVDFIIKEKSAFEVKFTKELYQINRYNYFKAKYPAIPLNLIYLDNVLEVAL